MTTRNWTALGTMAVALALLATPSIAAKGGGKGKPGGGGGGDPPPAADPHILYEVNDGTSGNPWVIKKCNADGTNQTLVLRMDDTVGVAARAPSWSPDRSEIVFTALEADGTGSAIYVAEADGTNVRRIVAGTQFQGVFDPTWSPVAAPDGEHKIAFSGSTDGVHGQVWICNTDGSELVNVTNEANRSDWSPAWSPDATSIAAGTSTTTALPRDILVYDLKADGSTVARDGSPTDATDGTALEGARVNDLDWSASGNVLVMSVDDESDSLHDDIWTLDLDDGSTDNLTTTSGNDERDPAWSPDGTKILFQYVGYKKEGKRTGLYTIDADGSNKTSLGVSDGRAPDWR